MMVLSVVASHIHTVPVVPCRFFVLRYVSERQKIRILTQFSRIPNTAVGGANRILFALVF